MELHVYEDKEETRLEGGNEKSSEQVVNLCTDGKRDTAVLTRKTHTQRDTRRKFGVCCYSLTPVGNEAEGTGTCSDKVWGSPEPSQSNSLRRKYNLLPGRLHVHV